MQIGQIIKLFSKWNLWNLFKMQNGFNLRRNINENYALFWKVGQMFIQQKLKQFKLVSINTIYYAQISNELIFSGGQNCL